MDGTIDVLMVRLLLLLDRGHREEGTSVQCYRKWTHKLATKALNSLSQQPLFWGAAVVVT